MKIGRRALTAEFLHPGRATLRGGTSRQVLAIAIFTVAVLFSGKALQVLGSDRDVLQWVAAILLGSGALAGALYHPLVRFWWRGAIAGAVAVASSFAFLSWYSTMRPEPLGLEFAIVVFLGAVPGMLVYYFLMRHQVVEE
jgi:hypothetical protein